MFINNPDAPRPLDITFDSEVRLHLHHNNRREPYDIDTASRTSDPPIYYIACCAEQRLDGQVSEKRYRLDKRREWVFCGEQRICWVPPGYVGSSRTDYCWVGSSLVLVGLDGMLRKLTFRDSSP